MNPFENDIFKFFWDNDTIYNTNRRKEVLGENEPPTIEQTANFVADVEDSKELIDKLYFIYRSEIPQYIGWFKNPTHDNGIGGYLPLKFYELLYKKTKFKTELFPLLPGEVQTDKMLKDYLKANPKGKISNFHKDELSDDILTFIANNHIFQVNYFKEEWWTPKAKLIIVEKVPFAITFIPEKLLTKREIIDYLVIHGEQQKSFMREFWKKIPHTFKKVPQIFGRWLAIIDGGLVNQYKNIYSEDYYTLEGLKIYFKEANTVPFHSWKLVKPEWKQELVDIALPKVHGAIAVDKDIELTDDVLEKTLKNPLSETTRSQIASRLQKEKRLTPELIKTLKLSFWGIDNLEKKEAQRLFKNEDVVDYLVQKGDNEFLKKKANWPKGMKIKREHIIPIMIALNFSYSRVKARLIDVLFEEDVFIWVYFEANKKSDKSDIRALLNQFINGNELTISEDVLSLLRSLNTNKDMTYDAFKSASDIFFF